MNKKELKKVKNFTYSEYCDYLKDKYGLPSCNYMTESFNKNPKATRTKEGLFAHHRFENHAIMLGNKEYAKNHPFEWQKKENIVYCDWLEHLLLHIFICKYPENDDEHEVVGIGGIQNHLIPELNDFYSMYFGNCLEGQPWQLTCFEKIKFDFESYIELIGMWLDVCKEYPLFNAGSIYGSKRDDLGLWDKDDTDCFVQTVGLLIRKNERKFKKLVK